MITDRTEKKKNPGVKLHASHYYSNSVRGRHRTSNSPQFPLGIITFSENKRNCYLMKKCFDDLVIILYKKRYKKQSYPHNSYPK